MQNLAVAINGRGQDLSAAFGELDTTFSEFDELFRTLDTQQAAVTQLFSNGAVALDAFRGREGQLADLIRNSNDVFRTTAARDRDIEALFRAFPTFEDESRLTLERLKEFAINTDPLMRQLVPAAEQLSPTLVAFAQRWLRRRRASSKASRTVIDRSTSGFPAFRKLLRDDFPPFLRAAEPFLRNLNPILTGLDLYKHEITAAMANVDGRHQRGPPRRERRTDPLPAHPRALQPRIAGDLHEPHLDQPQHRLQPAALLQEPGQRPAQLPHPPVRLRRDRRPQPGNAQKPGLLRPRRRRNRPKKPKKTALDFYERLKKYAFGGQDNSANTPAPGCSAQGPFEPIYGSGPATSLPAHLRTGQITPSQ